MSEVVKFKDIFGDENLITIGEKDVFIIFPGQKDQNGDPRVVMVPRSAILECSDAIRNGGVEGNE